jgi:uncharacterized protein YbaP (TraB family)
MNEAELIRYLELLGRQIRMLEGRNDVMLATLQQLIRSHPNPDVLETRVRAWLESPAIAEIRVPLSGTQLEDRQRSAAVMLGQLFPTAETLG